MLFKNCRQFYEQALSSITSTTDGRWALSELARAGPNVGEETIGHVRQVVGWDSWQAINEPLAQAGLLVHTWSSKKHDYFRLFAPLAKRFSRSAPDEAALTHVYIGQGVREEAAGILPRDCGPFLGAIDDLILFGMIRRVHWYGVEGLKTTDIGDSTAKPAVEERVRKAQLMVARELESLPGPVAHFLVEEVILAEDLEGRRVSPLGDRFRHLSSRTYSAPYGHTCLLDIGQMKNLRDRLMKAFLDTGLAVTAHSYISKGQDKLRGEVYVLAKELRHFVREWTASRGLPPFELPASLEAKHQAFHALADPASHGGVLSLSRLESQLLSEAKAEMESAIDAFARERLLTREGELVRVLHCGDFLTAVERRFRQPIVDFLLSGSPAVPSAQLRPGPRIPVLAERQEVRSTPPPKPKAEAEVADSVETPVTNAHGHPDAGDATKCQRGRAVVLGDLVSADELDHLLRQSQLEPDAVRERLTSRGDLLYPLVMVTTHTAIFGTTGSGKSYTTRCLIREFIGSGVPVMVLDWHDEYVSLIKQLGGIVAVPPTATVKASPTERPFTWNVLDPRFYHPKATEDVIQDYIGVVVDLLGHCDLTDLSEPMKGGLTESLKLAYDTCEALTFEVVSKLVERIAMPPTTADALRRRLQKFSSGSLRGIFCHETSFEPQTLFEKPTCVRVKHLTEEYESVIGLLTFFILHQAASYFKRAEKGTSQKRVRHVIIIDEAPRVIGRNPKVERKLVGMLQEMRGFGEGLVLVCRNPGISKDILRETNQKIAHKLDIPEDINPIGRMLDLDSGQKKLLHRLPPGVAFARIGVNATALARIRPH